MGLDKILRLPKRIASHPWWSTKVFMEVVYDFFRGLPRTDLAIDTAIDEGVAWLGRAQDHSMSCDGGVARHFSLRSGWAPSYPETTGYIIPTLLEYAKISGDEKARIRSRHMLNWLVSIQLPNGAFPGGLVDSIPVVPVAFNTGQILIGLAAGQLEFGNAYREPMQRAADWLVRHQDQDGCWRKYPSPFTMPGEKTYDTHIAWGLIEAAQLEGNRDYAEAALSNVKWALTYQNENGWFDKCCLSDPQRPLTHTLGYVFRGIVEAYRFWKTDDLRTACLRTADSLLSTVRSDGFIAGQLDSTWRGATSWACLTGSAQIACCWYILYDLTGNGDYLRAARLVINYLRRSVRIDGISDIRGALKGSFPIYGAYCPYEYPNWATKFFVDALMMEKKAITERLRSN